MSDSTEAMNGIETRYHVELPHLPRTWTYRHFQDVLDVQGGSQPPKSTFVFEQTPGYVQLLQIRDFGERGVPTYVREDLITKRCQEDDILIARYGASLGRIVTGQAGAYNVALAKVIFDKSLFYGKCLFYLLQTQFLQTPLQMISRSAQNGFNKGDLSDIVLPIAPLNEQRRIVAKIEELFSDLDAGVAALKRAKANLKRYRAAVLKAAVEGKLTEEWRATHPAKESASALLARILKERRQKWEADQLAKFAAAGKEPPKNWKEKYVEPTPPDMSGLPELPEGWCWASVEQTSEVQGGIQKQPKRVPGANSFPFLRVANVHRNRLELEEVHRIELFGDELERLRLQPDDLLVVEGNGSKTEIGRSAIWMGEIENCVHQNHVIRVRFLAGSSRYLNAYWNSPSGNGRVIEQAASTSGLYTLSVTKVCSLPIPLAPMVEQQQIVAEVEQRLSVIAAAETEIDHGLLRAARLRQSILKQAFEGKLVPQDPTDEPASVLLERLRASRLVHEGNGKAATPARTHPRIPRKGRII